VCFWLTWGGHTIKHAEQASHGLSQKALAELLSYRPRPMIAAICRVGRPEQIDVVPPPTVPPGFSCTLVRVVS
jgi:hypothetical protein